MAVWQQQDLAAIATAFSIYQGGNPSIRQYMVYSVCSQQRTSKRSKHNNLDENTNNDSPELKITRYSTWNSDSPNDEVRRENVLSYHGNLEHHAAKSSPKQRSFKLLQHCQLFLAINGGSRPWWKDAPRFQIRNFAFIESDRCSFAQWQGMGIHYINNRKHA